LPKRFDIAFPLCDKNCFRCAEFGQVIQDAPH